MKNSREFELAELPETYVAEGAVQSKKKDGGFLEGFAKPNLSS